MHQQKGYNKKIGNYILDKSSTPIRRNKLFYKKAILGLYPNNNVIILKRDTKNCKRISK